VPAAASFGRDVIMTLPLISALALSALMFHAADLLGDIATEQSAERVPSAPVAFDVSEPVTLSVPSAGCQRQNILGAGCRDRPARRGPADVGVLQNLRYGLSALPAKLRGAPRSAASRIAAAPPAPRSSRIVAPVAMRSTLIRDAADRGAPRSFAARPTIRIADLQNADIAGPASRGRSRQPAPRMFCAGNPADGNAQCDGLADVKRNRRTRGRASRLLGGKVAKQIGGVNIQGRSMPAGDSRQRHNHVAAETRSRWHI